MDAEILNQISNYNRSLFERLSNTVTPRGFVDAVCVSLTRELGASFTAGWVSGSDQFLVSSRNDTAWIRKTHLPGSWIASAAARIRFIARPSIEIDKGSPPDIELLLEPVVFTTVDFETVFLIPPEFAELIRSQKNWISLFQSFSGPQPRIVRHPTSEAGDSVAFPAMFSVAASCSIENSLAVAERQIAEKSVLFTISEIFGSTLPLEVKQNPGLLRNAMVPGSGGNTRRGQGLFKSLLRNIYPGYPGG